MCVPKSCSTEQLKSLWKFIQQTFDMQLELRFNDHLCTYKGQSIEPYKIDIIIL